MRVVTFSPHFALGQVHGDALVIFWRDVPEMLSVEQKAAKLFGCYKITGFRGLT